MTFSGSELLVLQKQLYFLFCDFFSPQAKKQNKLTNQTRYRELSSGYRCGRGWGAGEGQKW